MAKARAASKPPSDPVHDDQWRIPDALWERIEPLLPPRPPHPLGCHNPRVADRKAMDAIFFVLRTGCQWNALNATGICSSSSAHRRFQEWTAAGVFVNLWAQGLQEYDELKGLDWEWLAMDGAMTKAPLGGERTGRNPTDRGKLGHEAEPADGGQRGAGGAGRRGGQPPRQEAGRGDAGEHPGGAARADGGGAAGDVPGQGVRLRRHPGVGRGSSASRRTSGPGARRPRR